MQLSTRFAATMKLLIVAFLASSALAGRLDNLYVQPFGNANARFPANQFYNGAYPRAGHNFGNYNQYQGYSGYNANAPHSQILRYSNQNDGDGSYQFDYATSNGISQQEAGRQKNIDTNEVHGSYSYTSPEGKQISVNYVADEYGFRASGDHIPTPPPIPDAILRSLQYNAAHPQDDGQYRSNQYDSGYFGRNYNRGYRY